MKSRNHESPKSRIALVTSLPVYLVISSAISGCAGGGSSAGTASSPGQEAAYGALAVGLIGEPQVGTLGRGGMNVTFIAADITSARVNGAKSLKQTKLLFFRNNRLVESDTDGSNDHQITGNSYPQVESGPNWSPDGTKFAFSWIPSSSSTGVIANADGSAFTTLSGNHSDLTFNFNGSKLLYSDALNGGLAIFVSNLDGSSPQHITTPSSSFILDQAPAASPDGTLVAYEEKSTVSPTNKYALRLVSPSGTNDHGLLSDPNADLSDPSWAPDSKRVVFVSNPDNTNVNLQEVDLRNGVVTPLTTGAHVFRYPHYSPDGQFVIFTDFTNINAPTVRVLDLSLPGSNGDVISNGAYGSWSPFVLNRILVGSGGALSTTGAGGLLFGQNDMGLTSCVIADTATHTGIGIAASDGQNSSSPLFSFTVQGASPLTRIAYLNDPRGQPVFVVPGNGVSSVAGAVVTFDVSTGQVSTVIPFTTKRSSKNREFLGTWDAKVGRWVPSK